jgi:biopolymer transport protein ExbD
MAMSTGSRAQINMTPLIDVLLVLLIIFMVVAPLKPIGLNVLVPQPAAIDQKVRMQDIVVSIRADGTVLLNQEPVAAAELPGRLSRIFRFRGDDVVFVRGASGLEFRQVAGVIDTARGAGLTRVALMIEK